MKKLVSKHDFAEKTKNILDAITNDVPSPKYEEAKKFFLKSLLMF